MLIFNVCYRDEGIGDPCWPLIKMEKDREEDGEGKVHALPPVTSEQRVAGQMVHFAPRNCQCQGAKMFL